MALSCPLSWHFMASSHHQLSPFWLCWSYSESYCCETQKSQIVGFAAGSLVRKELLTELPSAVFWLYCELQQGLFRTSVCVYFVCVFCVCILSAVFRLYCNRTSELFRTSSVCRQKSCLKLIKLLYMSPTFMNYELVKSGKCGNIQPLEQKFTHLLLYKRPMIDVNENCPFH